MENENIGIKEKFDALFAEWEKVIQEPKIQLSSRPQDYIKNEPYREIVKLGKDVLPFIMEKLEELIIENFTLIICVFAASWLCLVGYGLSMA